METAHFVSHVSREVAKLLRKAGFDWSSIGYYNKLGFFHNAIPQHDELKAPSLDVAQKWLREVKGVDINILVESISNHKQYLVSIWFNISDKSAYDNAVLDNRYNTYEEAQEAGIKRALEILLEKKNKYETIRK